MFFEKGKIKNVFKNVFFKGAIFKRIFCIIFFEGAIFLKKLFFEVLI